MFIIIVWEIRKKMASQQCRCDLDQSQVEKSQKCHGYEGKVDNLSNKFCVYIPQAHYNLQTFDNDIRILRTVSLDMEKTTDSFRSDIQERDKKTIRR